MGKQFEIFVENELPATAEHVWAAVATGPGNLGWLYPMEIEPRVGGIVSRGPSTVTVWEPPERFECLYQDDDGLSATLQYLIEDRGDGTTYLRIVIRRESSGAIDDDWDGKTDQAYKHMQFYLHTLGQYLRYFNGRSAIYASAKAPEASSGADAFTVLRQALELPDDARLGDAVRLDVPGIDPIDCVVDYLSGIFIGLRSDDALYRFFGLNVWDWPIHVSHHLFAAGADQEKAEEAWRLWLEAVFTSG